MTVRFSQTGNTGVLTAYASVKTSAGVLSIKILDKQTGAKGLIRSALIILLNGQPILVSKNTAKPFSANCGCGCNPCKTHGKQSFQVSNSALLNQFGKSIPFLLRKLRSAYLAFQNANPNFATDLPCFLRIPICRATELRVITSCRLEGKSMVECTRQGEVFYNMCKGDC